MGFIRKGIARQEASNRQGWNAKHRTEKPDVSHKDQAATAKNDMFFKERGDARCGNEIAHSALESYASSILKYDYRLYQSPLAQ